MFDCKYFQGQEKLGARDMIKIEILVHH